jgi:acetyl esterase/lipase
MRRTLALTLILGFSGSVLAATPTAAGEQDCRDPRAPVTKDVEYVDDPISELQRLDVYAAETKGCAPVVIWVHGGGWTIGDKRRVEHKAELFNGLGYALVSVNYRLSMPRGDPARPVHPAHADDVGAAVAWVEEHIADYGGDGRKILLLGHSAGGHLVALVGLDPRFVEDAGGEIDSIRCVVPNDSEGYDIPARLALGVPRLTALLENAFGADPDVLADASPINHVDDRKKPPDFFIISRGGPRRVGVAQSFADTIEGADGKADVLDATPYTHMDVNVRLGEPEETVVTPPVVNFTKKCLVTK